jgi:hypothetical protein
MAERPDAPNAGRDAAGVGVLAPLAPPQPATRAPASSTGPSVRSQLLRLAALQKMLLNDVSLDHGAGATGSGQAWVPTAS